MSDRSDEVTATRESGSTDDLLEETDRLLSGAEAPDERSTGATAAGDESSEAETGRRSWLRRPSLPSVSRSGASSSSRFRLAPGEYFSPKAFLALVGALGVGLLVGDLAIPIAGRIVGLFAVAFAIGLVTSKRRYLETTAAGVSVGAVAAVFNHAFLTVAGLGQAVLAVGVTVGLVATLLGYYFGRDLKDGLSREV